MKRNPPRSQIHHRRSIRLRGGLRANQKIFYHHLLPGQGLPLWEVVQGKMILKPYRKIAQECWLAIPQHYPNTTLHEFIIMPNHVHGIIEIISKKQIPTQEKR